MVCKQSELVSAINSFGAARASGDPNLIGYAGQLIEQLLKTIEFAPEEPPASEGETSDDQSEPSS